ncbi:MAG TPA: agmatinase [bacterium]|jgi:agmatinase
MSTFQLLQGTPFLGANPDASAAKLVLFGCPYDSTISFRPGSRFGPQAIRTVSDVLETYCPVMDMDLEDVAFADAGDLLLPPGDTRGALDAIRDMASSVYARKQVPAGLGGEHLLSLPLVEAALRACPDLVVVQFDAHMDMRSDYLGVELSHATVMKKVSDQIGSSRVLHIGCRSGTREEFHAAKTLGNLKPASITGPEIAEWVGDRPLYVTVDLDILDPSILPGTGTPEPGGVQFATLQNWLIALAGKRWVGWDVMELSPMYDSTQVSSIVAAKVVRTMILASTV